MGRLPSNHKMWLCRPQGKRYMVGVARRAAIFLDRDGTLVHPRHYPSRPEQLVLYEGLGPELGALRHAGYRLVVVTNQSGLARGHFTPDDLARMHLHLRHELHNLGVRIDGIYHCPHHPDGVVTELAIDCDCRKPRPGMLKRAARDLDIDLGASWMVGDILDDIEAGKRAGCRTVLVDLGSETLPASSARQPDFVATTTAEALRIIRRQSLAAQPLTPLAGESVQPRPLIDTVRGFRRLRALVVGDAMLDTYLEGTATRLCREGPVPVVRKTAEEHEPGGAANTAANLSALGADVIFLGIVGKDTAGVALRHALRQRGVDDSRLIEDDTADTLQKLRILANGQYVVRFDAGEARPVSAAAQRRLLSSFTAESTSCDLLVVSDYGYGAVTDAVIGTLSAHREPPVLVVDSKDLGRFKGVPATLITPNHVEARAVAGMSPLVDLAPRIPDVERAGHALLSLLRAQRAAITMASEGVLLVAPDGSIHLPVNPVTRASDVGAGDSFTATTALALAAGASPRDACVIGIEAAGIAVTKRRTAVVGHQELLQRISLHESDTPSGPESLAALLDEERRRGKSVVFTNGVFDILHAGHVFFLREARRLGDILVVAINSDSSARRLKGEHRPINGERDRAALVGALDGVDHVIIFDQETPEAMIRLLKPDIHVKGGDYAREELPEAEAVRETGGRVVIVPLAGSGSTTAVLDRIVSLLA